MNETNDQLAQDLRNMFDVVCDPGQWGSRGLAFYGERRDIFDRALTELQQRADAASGWRVLNPGANSPAGISTLFPTPHVVEEHSGGETE